MSDALRQLLCEFVIEVDKAGELKRGNAQIEALKDRLHELQTQSLKSSKAVEDVFSKAATRAAVAVKSINASLMGAGGGGSDGFAAAGAMRRSRLAGLLGLGGRDSSDGFAGAGAATGGSIGAQFGPTRATLDAGRASMRAADAAAQRYAETLRGKFANAFAAAKANVGSGGSSGGGLIQSLFSLRTAMIGFGAGQALRGAIGLVDHIGGIGEAAAKLGTSTDDFQRLSILAQQNATSVETLGTAFKTLANSAVQPTKESAAAFQQLGVSTKDSAGNFKSSQALFWESAEALADVGNETERSALAQDLFGRSAQDLKPILAGGSEAVRRQREELTKLKLISPETIAAADRLSDSWVVMKTQLMAAAEPLVKLLIPVLGALGKGLVRVSEFLSDFVSSGRAARLGFVGLALGAARFIAPLRLMIGLGGGFVPLIARMSAGLLRFSGTILKTLGPLLLLEDILGFFMGKDSLTGRGIEAAFGRGALEGVQKTISDLTEAFKDLWKWVLGDGAGEKFKGLAAEISLGMRLLINDLLAAIPLSGRTAGLAGLAAHEGKINAAIEGSDGSFLGDVGAGFAAAFGGSDIAAPAIAAPGGAGGSTYVDQRTISTSVHVATGASPGQIASQTGAAVQRSSATDLAALESD